MNFPEKTKDSISVSVVIPTRNRSEMVCQAILSVEKQIFPEIEIIVVDDGSVDNTCEVIKTQFSRVQVIRLDGKGPGAARNAGVDAASGEIIMFLDSDDLWLPDHARKLYATLNRGFEVAYGTTLTWDIVNGGEFLIPDNGLGEEGNCLDNIIRWCFTVPSSIAMSRKAFYEVNGFVDNRSFKLGEDWEFFIRLAAEYPFGFSGVKPITMRCLHQGSLCRMTSKSMILQMLKMLQNTIADLNQLDYRTVKKFTAIEEFTKAEGELWTTVQEWYSAMKREKLI